MKATTGRAVLWTVLSAAALGLADPGTALACPACFSQAEGPMADATRLGLWLLLGLTLCLQGGFVAFFLYLRRRAAQAADRALDEEWSALQAGWNGPERSGTR